MASTWQSVGTTGPLSLPGWQEEYARLPLAERVALLQVDGPPPIDDALVETVATESSRSALLRLPVEVARLPWRLRRHAPQIARTAARLPVEAVRIVAGRSEVAPARDDRRFDAPAWEGNPAFKRLMQLYLAVIQSVDEVICAADLDWPTERRIRLAAENVVDAVAPTNLLLTNPEGLKRIIDTGGSSVVTGAKQLARDMARAPRIPTSVDESKFEIGRNLALTPGSVVLRTEAFELLQYRAATPSVREVPILLCSSMINKYYVLDIQPGRSLIEHLVAQGQTVFVISWRNPQREHGGWTFDDYASSVLEALDACEEISGADSTHLLGLCAGGLVTSAAACVLTARGEGERLRTLTLCITPIDAAYPGAAGSMVTPETAPWLQVEAARRGYVEGRQLAGTFAWTKPNEGVWNFWVNNYVLGKRPPAVDILYWAADATNVPGALNRDMVRISLENAFARESSIECLGASLDVSAVKCDNYVFAAETDHLTPWHGCYPAVHLLGGRSRFALGNRGHIGAVVNRGGRGARFATGPTHGRSAEQWLADARTRQDTWWTDWVPWLQRRSGDRVAAPGEPGSAGYPPLEDAPGSYVRIRGD